VLRIFGFERDEAMSVWRKCHNKELNNFYPSRNINRLSKSRNA
jgi:hypothetical protein